MNQYNNATRKPKPKGKGSSFSNYDGKFSCQRCKADVVKARFWRDTYDFTWMCDCKFISKVNLYGKGY
jgi:hypothetical protein